MTIICETAYKANRLLNCLKCSYNSNSQCRNSKIIIFSRLAAKTFFFRVAFKLCKCAPSNCRLSNVENRLFLSFYVGKSFFHRHFFCVGIDACEHKHNVCCIQERAWRKNHSSQPPDLFSLCSALNLFSIIWRTFSHCLWLLAYM